MPRGKAPPGVFPSQSRDSRPPSYSSRSADRRSGDLTVHRGDDRDRGLIHIGADRDRVHVAGGLYNFADRLYDRRFCPPYGYGHYYHNYRPIYYPGSRYYTPFYGYSYASVYLTAPFVVSVYEDTPTYVSSSYAQEPAFTNLAPDQALQPSPPPAPADSYQPLTPQQQPPTAVVEGNAAFADSRFDEARRLYVRAVLADERDGYAKILYAWANFALGDYPVAAASIRRSLLTTNDLIDYPMDLRTLYSDPMLLEGQKEALLQFVRDHPDDREAELVLGYLYYSVGQAERAAGVFTGLAGADQNDTLLSLLRDAAVRNARGSSPPPAAP
jgi:tetratricopeptide (TPR) repeat protein